MNVPDAFATLSSGSGKEEGENVMALKMLVETLTNVAFDNVKKNDPEILAEMTTVVRFFNVLMNALENDMARKSALPLVSIQIWKSRDEKRLEIELESAPADVQKKWQKLMKKEAKQEPTKMQVRRNLWLFNLTLLFFGHFTSCARERELDDFLRVLPRIYRRFALSTSHETLCACNSG